jgi:RimJ/RimL family protein N-acetyltransferase
LETRRIRLREIENRDFPTLFKWRNTEKFKYLFHYNENEISYDKFREEFTWDATVRKFQYLIEVKNSNEPVGLAFVHTYSEEDKDCFLNIFLSEPFEKKGYGVDVFVLFFLFLFNQIGIKKLFVEASEYNEHSIACIRNSGMVELSGPFTKKIHAGKEYDIIRFEGDNKLLPRFIRINEHLTLPKYSTKDKLL